ncbi:hypothetical protein TWF481_008404 [Arthrobotrys musiformis]|uniref:Uncharacterized protein n=1 Tax=Arthrobotrys musiformis TaxID=47236 RepID=A0AAV9W8W8_9PEZI
MKSKPCDSDASMEGATERDEIPEKSTGANIVSPSNRNPFVPAIPMDLLPAPRRCTPGRMVPLICFGFLLVVAGTYFGVRNYLEGAHSVATAPRVTARDLNEANINAGRYAYQSIHHSQNARPKRPDQVVPLVEIVENGETILARVSHTHPTPIPLRIPRDFESQTSEATTTTSIFHSSYDSKDIEKVVSDINRRDVNPADDLKKGLEKLEKELSDIKKPNLKPGDDLKKGIEKLEKELSDVDKLIVKPPNSLKSDIEKLEAELAAFGKRSQEFETHTDYTSRTVPYSTDSTGLVYYQTSNVPVPHTHSGYTPIAPVINLDCDEDDATGDDCDRGYKTVDRTDIVPRRPKEISDGTPYSGNPAKPESTTSLPFRKSANYVQSSTPTPAAQVQGDIGSKETAAPSTTSRVAKTGQVISANHSGDFGGNDHSGSNAFNASHGDSSYTHNHTHFSVGHDDGDGDVHVPTSNDTIVTISPRYPQTAGSIIADAFFNINRTVTHVSGPTWRQVTTTIPPAPPVPTNKVVGPIVSIFEPATNVTFEVIPMEGDDPEGPYSVYWNPVSTGAPTRADHVSIMSSYRANGGTNPPMPTRYDIVWDHRTNTTWNKTIEGTWDNWVEVYVSITTQYPAPPKTPVTAIPTRPWQDPYDEITNPFFTVEAGPNWVGPTSDAVGTRTHQQTESTVITPTPTNNPTPKERSHEPTQVDIDHHYPVPFFPGGPGKYDVWSEWIGYCGVIKHITQKGEPRIPLKPFGDFTDFGGGYIRSLCFRGIDYYLHIDDESRAASYWLNRLVHNRNISHDGYADALPTWNSYNGTVQDYDDFIRPEWITDCVVLLHHARALTWGNNFLYTARSNFDANGRRYISADRDQVKAPSNCPRIDILLHVEEDRSIDGFLLGDWWVTPGDDQPFYVAPQGSDAPAN